MAMFDYTTGDIERDAEIFFAEEELEMNQQADEQEEIIRQEFGDELQSLW